MNKIVNAAIIGHGGMGHFHSSRIAENPEMRFVGAWDINPAQLKDLVADSSGTPAKAYSSQAELLADETVELVVVATPNDVHKEIVVAALEAGKNVVCEKPIAMNVAELEEMIAAANKAGKLFTVHQNRRWDPDFLQVRKIFDERTIGPIFRIESRVHGSRGIPGDWRNQKVHGGGMIFDWGIHIIDQMLILAGKRKLLSIYAQTTNVTNTDCDDGFFLEARFSGNPEGEAQKSEAEGFTYHAEVGTSNFINLPRWYVLGEDGSAIIRNWQREGEIVKVSDWENRDAVPIIAGVGLTKTMAPRADDTIKTYPLPEVTGDWKDFYRNVCAVLRGEAEPIVTHEQQLRLMRLIEDVFISAQENRVIYFEHE